MPAMGKVIFLMNVSLDGYSSSRDGGVGWSDPDDELFAWFTERTRSMEVLVYGRRLFETMNAFWPTRESDSAATDLMIQYARAWNSRRKVVVSNSMEVAPPGWRLTRGDPEQILDDVGPVSGDIEIGGPTLAAEFVRRGLVDEYQLVVHPVILGGGTPMFPELDRSARLRLLETRTFPGGAVYLSFAPR
jgi:dihydrofolate reductase